MGHSGERFLAALVISIGMCAVPVLAQINVDVSSLSISFNDGTDGIKEGSSSHQFDIDLTITLSSTSVNANEQGNMNRWAVSLEVQNSVGVDCASSVVNLTPAQAGVAIATSGQGTLTGLTATLDLSGCLCSGASKLTAILTSQSYTLTGTLTGSQALSCNGIVGNTLTLLNSGTNLVENADGQMVTLDIIGNSESQGRSVTCASNCWSAEVYLATGDITNSVPIAGTTVTATVPSPSISSDWQAGATLRLSDITAVLNLNGIGSCDSIDLICTSLTRNPSSVPVFSIVGSSIVSCAPVTCIGVLINNVIPAFTSPTTIKQGVDNTGLQLTVTLKADDTKASVTGTGLWQANAFGNADANCLNPTKVPATLRLTDGADYGLDASNQSVWSQVEVDLNMAQYGCNDAKYLCIEVLKGASPSTQFSLSFKPDVAKYGAIQINCDGLVVVNGNLNVNAATQLAAFKDDHTILFDATFNSDSSSGGVGGTDLWEVRVFPAFESDGTGTTGPVTVVPLQAAQLIAAFPANGGPLVLSDLTATISLASNPCGTYRYLCARLAKKSTAMPDFTINDPTPNVCSSLLSCKNVILTSTTVTPATGSSPNGLPLYEGVSNQEIYFDAVLQSDQTAGSVPSGTDHWQFTVAPGAAIADLTQAQKDATLTAGQPLSFTRVQAALDLTNIRCAALGDVCAEVMRSPDDTLNFVIDSATALNTGCFTPTCQGVEITSLIINDGVTNFALKEGTQDHMLTFSVAVTSNPNAGSVRGTDLWKMTVYLSMDNTNTGLVMAEATAGGWSSQDVLAGQDTTLTDVQVTLDLNAKCTNMQFLCIQLARADAQNFLLDPALNNLQACKPVPQCNGIEVETMAVGFRDRDTLVEGVASNTPVVEVDLTYTDTSASVIGTNIWHLTIYGSGSADGSDPKIAQQMSTTSGNSVPGMTVKLDGVTWTVDMSSRLCVDVTHLCVEARLETAAPFTLLPSSIQRCSPLECQGIVISSEDFTFTSTVMYEATQPQSLVTNIITAQAVNNGASIADGAARIWEVSLFLNSANNGSGQNFQDANGMLTNDQQMQGISSANPLTFNTDLTFEFSQNVVCGAALYVCLEIAEQSGASPDYDITFPQIPTCKEVTCIGVVFQSADLSTPDDTIIIENEERHPVTVTFSAATAPVTATLQSGSNFWRLSVFANTEADGSGAQRYGEAPAILSRAQRDTQALASDTVELAGVRATLNLDNFVCPSKTIYLCAELQRDPTSTTPFTIQGTPSPLVACKQVECQGVLITNIGIMGLPPAIVENEVNPLLLNVTADIGGADASGTNLWRMNASLVYDGMVLASEEVNLGNQANTDVVAMMPVTFTNLPVPFDLQGLVCPSNGTVMLCLELSRSGSANTDFTVTGVTKKCEVLPCLGVVIVQSAVRASTGSLLESKSSNPITLDLSYSSDAAAASISGNGLWSIKVFGNDRENGLGPRMAETTGVLQGNDANFPLPKGETVEFNGVTAVLNLSPYLVCEEVRWVCAELLRGSSPTPDFSLSDTNNARIACTSLACKGVQIARTTLSITDTGLTEDSGSQVITVDLITLMASPESSRLLGNPTNFKAVIFGNSMGDTSGPKVAETMMDLSVNSVQEVDPGGEAFLLGTVTLNLTNVFCADLKYLCVRIYRGDNPPFNYKLEGVPTENSLVDCQAMMCKGVRVTDGNVQPTAPLLEGNPSYPIEFTVSFDTDADGASVRAGGSNLFELKAFLASTSDGGDPKTDEHDVTIPEGSESQPVTAGNPITFVGAVVNVDTTDWTCQAQNFLCVRLMKDSQASVNFQLEGWDVGSTAVDPTRLQKCAAITCQGVDITNVIFKSIEKPYFKERDPATNFNMDLGLVANPSAGGVVGTGLWKLTFALNTQMDGMGQTFGTETVAVLSEENANRGVNPTGPMTNLTDVKVSMPGVDGVRCSVVNPFYMCVKVEKADGSSPDFTLTAVDWSCTPITCYPVRITELSFTVTSPVFIRENNANFLHVDLSVSTDDKSASVSGTGLWASPAFEIRNAANAQTLASTGSYWGLTEQNMDLGSNETIQFTNIFPVTFTPSGLLCDQMTQLCMTFAKGATPSPNFDVDFIAPAEVCMPIECRGVMVTSTVISSIVSGDTVTERKPGGQNIDLTITSTTEDDAASIAGTDLWALTLYYTPNANGDVDPTFGSTEADLTAAQRNMALMAGQDFVISNAMKAALDVTNLVCPEVQLWLCARLGKHTTPNPQFSLSGEGGNAALIGCKNITCIGVEIEDTSLVVVSGGLIPVEKAPSHVINFAFQSTASLRSAEVSGTGLWKLTAFANRRADGTHHRRSYEDDVILTTAQMNTPITQGVTMTFASRTVDINLQTTDTECREIAFFCGQLRKGNSPSTEFSLQGIPDDNTLINCEPIDCNGVKIATFGLTNTGSTILRENQDDQVFSFEVSLTSDFNKDSVSGDNLWRFRAFLNDAADCLGDAAEVSLTDANIRPGQEDQDLAAGGTINFNVDVSLDYRTICPASWESVNICLEVFIGTTSSQAFTLFGDILKGAKIDCRGVEVTETDIHAVNQGGLIIESDTDVAFDLNLRVSTVSEASSIFGSGLWMVDVFVSDTESCQMATTDRVTSALSPFNLNKDLTAGAVLVLDNVQATVPLRGALCENLNYVCAVLAKGPNPSPDFTLVPVPDATSLLASEAIECKGLHILSSTLTLTMGEPLISNQPQHPIAFQYSFQTDPDGSSVFNPTDLFRLQVAATDSPTRAGVLASNHQVTLPYSPDAPFSILAGQMIYLPVEANLNLRGAKCDEIPFICMTLMKGLNPVPPYTLTPDSDDPVLTACSERLDCIGVRIASEGLTISSGIPFKEHAASNPVELTVSLTADDTSGNAIGDNLWSAEVKLSFNDPMAPGTTFLAATTANFVGADGDTDLQKGQTIQLRLEADLSLTGISCSDVRYLVVNITNPNANPEFSLEWREGGPEYVVVSKLFTCSGVSLQPGSLSVTSGFPLLELAPAKNVTFAVRVQATADSATVTGQDLWKVTAFVSPNANGASVPEDQKKEADLTSAQGMVPITAGSISGINDIEITLDASGKYCSDMAYLCVEVWRGAFSQPYYNIQSPADLSGLRMCQPTTCNGVQILQVTPVIESSPPLIEMRPNQVVNVDVMVTSLPTSAGIEGDNLWAATVFVNSQADGSGTKSSVREAIIDPIQSSKDLDPSSVLTLEDLVATMDFTGIPCSQMAYICVTLQEGSQAQPDFNLEDSSALTSCAPTNCISVAIASGTLSLKSNEVLQGDDQAMFSFDASFLPWLNSRSLQEDNSWVLHAFTTNSGDGLGAAFTLNQVTLTANQHNQGVTVGTPLSFNDSDVILDVSSQTCATTTHLCVRLGTKATVSFILGGYPTSTSLVACAELRCFSDDVVLTATEVTERRIKVEFTEALGDFDLYRLTYSPSDGITTSPYDIPRNLPRLLYFDQLVPGQLYTIQLTLRDGADQKAGPYTLIQRTKPDPVLLQLDSVSASDLSVSWNPASGVFDHYVLTLDPPDGAQPPTPYIVQPGTMAETFTHLLSARQYNVTIRTVSGTSSSQPSSVVAYTDPSTPVLRETSIGERTVGLAWFINAGYTVDKYEIRYQPATTTPQPITYPKESNTATLDGLVPGRIYTISLVAVSNVGGSMEIRSPPYEITVQTRPVPPAEITYEDISETSVAVKWPSADGEVDHYTVTFTPLTLPPQTLTKVAPRQLLYQNLDVASEYMVSITTSVSDKSGNGLLVSRPVQLTVYTLPYPPGAVNIVKVTTTTIEIQWQDANGPREGYEVTFNPNEPEFSPQSPFFTTGNTMLLTGIKPHVTVDFEVRTKISNVLSNPRTLRQRTFPTLPGKVRDFEIVAVDTDNVLISFKVPEDPNGLILAYLVSVEGTKPGQPSESAFQTITALPNDVQFEEVISPLKAGYTYTLSIQATNTEGSGELVELSPVTLPIKEPFYSGGPINNENFIVGVTATTITIRIPNTLFSNQNGEITAYTILVVGVGENETAELVLPSYQQVRNDKIKRVYQSSEPSDLFNADGNQVIESVDFVIGKDAVCPNFGYCNGALDPITQYKVRVRAFTENGLHTDSPWSDVVTTKFDPLWFMYVLIPFLIIVLIIAFIMALCTCIAGDRKSPPPSSGKQAIPMEQGNENMSNNAQVASVAPEPVVLATPPPKKSPTSRPVAVSKFGQHVRKMSARTGDNFAKEYQDLNGIGETENKSAGALPQNIDKNRYSNIIPFDFNRVSLSKDDDYINASLLSGFNGDNEYIAAQGPQANSVNDFWQMVWEQNVPVIAAVGTCVEKGRVKFAQYWPSDSTPITFGEVTVNRVSEREETELGYTVRDFCLESGSEVRSVRQFLFTAWPLHGVPKKSDQILHFIRAVRSQLPSTDAGPLVVHCGAGIGRTGVFIAVDILTQHLALDDDYIDVFGTVATKRGERINMVQTELQYEFVHKALLDILEGRVSGPNWTLKAKRRSSIDSDQRVEDDIAETTQ